MIIGYAGPIAFDMLRPHVSAADADRYGGTRFPQGSLLIAKLLDLGHDVVVYTLDHEQRADEPLVLTGDALRVHVLPYRKRLRWIDAFRDEIRHLRAAILEDRPDLVHAQWSYEYALAAMGSGLPHLVTVRDWSPLILRMQSRPMEYVYRMVRWGMDRRVLGRADRLTVTSPYMVELLKNHAGREPDLVPNALADHVFAPNPTPASQREPIVVSINNGFDHRKNVDTLLTAFAQIRSAVPAAELRLIGGGYGPNGPAAQWAERHGLRDGVTFVSTIPFAQVLAELRGAAVLAHPSREESFGGTLLEAMASGAPVVGGVNSGAVPWVLDGGRAGILTDIEDPSALAAAVLNVLQNPDTADRLAADGRDRARAFDLDSTAKRYLEAYAEVLETRRSKGRSE